MSYDVIDLRDLATELNELRTKAKACPRCLAEVHKDDAGAWVDDDGDAECLGLGIARLAAEIKPHEAPATLDDDEADRLEALEALDRELNDLEGFAKNEPSAITDDGFEEYAEDLARDIGAIGKEDQWPLGHIDWKAAAEALQVDYRSFEFDGRTYWVRSY